MSQVTRTQARIPTELMEWVKQQAQKQNRSMNNQIVEFLLQARRSQQCS